MRKYNWERMPMSRETKSAIAELRKDTVNHLKRQYRRSFGIREESVVSPIVEVLDPEENSYTKDQVLRILKKHGIKMTIEAYGCCSGPKVSMEYKGNVIVDEEYRPIPEWAKDRHTVAGKMAGQGFASFIETEAKLANKMNEVDPYSNEALKVCKDLDSKRVKKFVRNPSAESKQIDFGFDFDTQILANA